VWPNNLAITFKGTVASVEQAFRVTMGRYSDDRAGRVFFSNQQEPTLPTDLLGITQDLIGLNNAYPYSVGHPPEHSADERPQTRDLGEREQSGVAPQATLGNGVHFLSPSDLAMAYDINLTATDGSAIQGQGQRIAIIIDSDVNDSDVALYRTTFNLPQADLVRYPQPGFDEPGNPSDEGEASLDVSHVSAAAPLAEIDLVLIESLSITDVLAAQEYIVNTLMPQTVNESFGGCESDTYSLSERMLMEQAAMSGISFFAISGDEGAECSDRLASGKHTESGMAEVECPACFEAVTAVGGTGIMGAVFEADGSLVAATDEVAWNQSPGVRFGCNGKFLRTPGGHGSSGGGQSLLVAKPKYQINAEGFFGGVPPGEGRFVPDVAAPASLAPPATAYFLNGKLRIGGGTSKASPFWAGLMALIDQFTGKPQGCLNPELYRLGVQQYRDKGPLVFIDITEGNNSTLARKPCVPVGVTGNTAVYGYDSVTGWGSPDLANLAKNYGVMSGAAPPSTPAIKTLSSRLGAEGVLTLNVVSTDSQGVVAEGEVTLLDASGAPVSPLMPISLPLVRHSTEAAYSLTVDGLDQYLQALQAQLVLVNGFGNASFPMVASFNQADSRGPSLTLAAFNGSRMLVKGADLTGDLRLEVNDLIVARVTGELQRVAKFKGKAAALNLHKGVNRIRVEKGPFFSNIFLLTL
jgi:subtilase family serine protease